MVAHIVVYVTQQFRMEYLMEVECCVQIDKIK